MKLATELIEREGARNIRRPKHPEIIVRDYERGLNVSEICKRYEMTRMMVEKVLKESGIKLRRRKSIEPKIDMYVEEHEGRGRPALVPQKPKQLVKLYEDGLTIEEIAEECGLTRYLVRKTLLDQGVQMKRGHPGKASYRKGNEERQERVHKIVELRGQGLTLRSIGEELGISYERVRKILKGEGLETGRRHPNLI